MHATESPKCTRTTASFGVIGAQCTQQADPPCQVALNRLEKELARQSDAIDRLKERLAPVMRAENTVNKEPHPTLAAESHLHGMLLGACESVDSAASRLERMVFELTI